MLYGNMILRLVVVVYVAEFVTVVMGYVYRCVWYDGCSTV